jgi:hypothetical protein
LWVSKLIFKGESKKLLVGLLIWYEKHLMTMNCGHKSIVLDLSRLVPRPGRVINQNLLWMVSLYDWELDDYNDAAGSATGHTGRLLAKDG